MQLLDNHLMELCKNGIIDKELAIANANNPNYLKENLA
jgi:Tfp pilus assembly ATPase PilU